MYVFIKVTDKWSYVSFGYVEDIYWMFLDIEKDEQKSEESDANSDLQHIQKPVEDRTEIEEINLINDPEVYKEFYKSLNII